MKSNRTIIIALIFIGMIYSSCISAQTAKIDSLKKVLRTYTTEDTAKANTMIALCQAYLIDVNYNGKIQELTARLLILSQKLKFKKGIAYSYLNLGVIDFGEQKYEHALIYYCRALALMEEIGNKKGISSCLQNIGYAKLYQGKYKEAIDYTLKGAKIKEEIGDKRRAANGYTNIGNSYANMGDYQQATNYFFKALKLSEEINDSAGISSSYLNIGGIFYEQHNFEAALGYNEKALKIKILFGDRKTQGIIYSNIANIFSAQEKYQKALMYNLQAMQIAEEINDKQGVNNCCTNIGNNYVAQNKFNEALPYFLKALKSSIELGDKAIMISSYNGLGKCYEQQKNYSQALKQYSEALQLSKDIGFKSGIRDAYGNLSSVNEKLEKLDQALAYNKLFSSVKDSILNEESLKQTAELNTRYETEKKEKEILLLTKDQQLKDKTLKEQQLVRIGLIIGLALFLSLSFVLFNRYRFKQKANLILEKQKQEIHKKNMLITDSIDYAKTIQEAILPTDEKLNAFFPEHFIFYKPKAIVSGDFYWIGKKDDKLICAVADCTGHGVPGAFMSLLGHNILENILQRDTAVDPGTILTALNEEIVMRFSNGKEMESVKHAMDIAIISIDNTTGELQHAGAKNSIYLIRQNELTELKADRMSTGIISRDYSPVIYTNNKCKIQKGDVVYLFSDGFPDQRGGPDKKKFYYQPFKDLLATINNLPLEEQKQQLDNTIHKWMGDGEQIDDILVMGIKI
jgi:serine phosphatase RsbU (regulator of sigma subunit)/Tfp pilus assembly protein PilF